MLTRAARDSEERLQRKVSFVTRRAVTIIQE
jgi:hypothetical protein